MLTLGDELEYRVARLQLFMGYFVRRSCVVHTAGDLDRATDLDVLALRYVEPFRRELLITECKSRNGGPLDRIFWLSGVREFVGAQEAILVRKGTKWNIKDFARQCGVQVIDLFRVTELEATYGIAKDDWPGVSDRAFYGRELAEWNRTLSADTKFWELYLTLTSEIHYDEPFPAINYLLAQLRILTRSLPRTPSNSFHRYLLSECLSQLAVFVMRVAEQSFDLSPQDRAGFIRKGLTYGSLEPRYADRILNSAYNLARQAVFHYTNRSVDLSKSLFEMPNPPEVNDIVNIVEEITKTYPASLNFPQICDLTLTEAFTKSSSRKGWLRRIFPQSDLSVRLELVRKVIRVLISGGACPSYVLDALTVPLPESVTAAGGGEKSTTGTHGAAPVVPQQGSGIEPHHGSEKQLELREAEPLPDNKPQNADGERKEKSD
jgi:hypothetical protein